MNWFRSPKCRYMVVYLKCLIYLMFFLPVTMTNITSKYQINLRLSNTCTTIANEYKITCIDVEVNDLTSKIEKEVQTFPNQIQTIEELKIENLSSDNRTLFQNWIDTTSFRIKTLRIISAKIDSIENNAFKGYAFEKIENLELEDMKIDTLEEGTFEGLQSIIVLSIEKCEIRHINEMVLKPVASSLRSLYFKYMILPINPVNITGTVHLPALRFFGFSFNNVGSLNEKSFSQVENPEIVFLQNAQIQHIDCGSFKKMTKLYILSLDSNLLTTLDPCVFGDEVISSMKENVLTLSDNEWNCNCDLEWLKSLKINNNIGDDPTCASHQNLTFEKVDFCESTTSDSTTQDSTTQDSTTQDSTTQDSTTQYLTTEDLTTPDSTTQDSTTSDSTTSDSTTIDSTTDPPSLLEKSSALTTIIVVVLVIVIILAVALVAYIFFIKKRKPNIPDEPSQMDSNVVENENSVETNKIEEKKNYKYKDIKLSLIDSQGKILPIPITIHHRY